MKKLLKIAISMLLVMSCLSACGKNKVYKYTKCTNCEQEKNCYEVQVSGVLDGRFTSNSCYVCDEQCEKELKTRCERQGKAVKFEVVYQ